MAVKQDVVKSESRVDVGTDEPKNLESSLEYCQNPWNNSCQSPDIQLYILYGDKKIPICRGCWQRIAETDFEW